MTLPAWQALLSRLRERLESLGVTLHEIEESAGGMPRRRQPMPRIGSNVRKPSSSSARRMLES